MKDNVGRNHWIFIIKNLITLIKNNIFLLILLGINKKAIYCIGIFLLLIIITSILRWRKTIFYIDDHLFVYKEGIISRSKQEIPFNKINTIDVGQTLLDGIFNVVSMKIDTGSNGIEKSELKIVGNKEYIKNIKDKILGEKQLNSCEERSVESNLGKDEIKKTITNKEIIKYALTKSKIGWALGGFFILIGKLDDIGRFFHISFSKLFDKYVSVDFIKGKSILGIILILILLLILAYMVIVVLSIIFEWIMLYNFTLSSDGQKISVSYGCLSKKEYSFNIDKIYGLRYKQSIIQQILNLYTVEVITMGYGDEKNEKAILYPIADENFKNHFVKNLIPNICFEGQVMKPPKSSLKRFVLRKIIIWSIILIPIYIFIKSIPENIKIVGIIVAMIYCFISGYLNYINTSLGVKRQCLMATTGNFFKTTTVIGQDNVQSITKRQGIFQRFAKVCDYKIDLYSNKIGDILHVRYMKEDIFSELQENLIL